MNKKILLTGVFFLFFGVVIGAFGAHGLKVDASKLAVFETGVRYQFYHGFALMVLGLLALERPLKSYLSFSLGILLFSFNCYLYVLTEIKTFAMIVPLGGISFLIGWICMGLEIKKRS